MRTDNLVELLAAHKNSDDKLIDYAKSLTPREVETSTDPKVLRIRRMVYSVQGELHRMRGFVRLEPFGGRVLWGRMSPDHEIGLRSPTSSLEGSRGRSSSSAMRNGHGHPSGPMPDFSASGAEGSPAPSKS